ncbi:tripartite tricarboxylate transporter permease [Candidatus Formimonas warabiya]|uniref:Transporter n=1 Tax=Formimonas warabiya TaxID=1761012 RepID=A0A3G1KM18_FORW1|nr:tripartite tricarboxylate transporter permease [Candidatus Formimonas warabiya]ATW23478.1 transporter [Candidatus Formimonas warabiya]
MLESLWAGFVNVMHLTPLLACFAGVLMGTLVGILPGIGPSGTMALMLPFTFSLDPTSALIMLAGIYYGAQYGGSTTSILLNLPGEASSVMTAIEGYQMAKKGRGGAALTIAAVGSFIAGTVSIFGLIFLGPPLAKAALSFGPPEIFSIMVLGFVILSTISGGSTLKSGLMILVGLMVGTVGFDNISGVVRFTFGSTTAMDGIEFIPVVMGIFGIAEILWSLVGNEEEIKPASIRLRDLYPNREEISRSVAPVFRGSILGFLIGLIPGPSAVISTMVSYAAEKRLSKHGNFGQGAIEGIAGPESANNATSTGALIPLLVLGIPFAPPTAILLSGLMLQGIIPGPLLFTQHADIFWGLVASMYIGNVLLLIFNLPLVGVFASLLRIRPAYLNTLIISLCLIGAFSLSNRMFEMWIVVVFGIIGFLMQYFGYKGAPLVLGIVLGPMLETNFRRSLIMLANPAAFLERPITVTILLIATLIIILPFVLERIRKTGEKRA